MSKNIYYNNINNLLKTNVQLEYEAWQIKEIVKCRKDISYFLKQYVKIVNLDDGLVPFKLYDYQEDFINKIDKHNRFIGLQSRQSGKTTTTAGYILHYIIFKSYKTVGILANKGDTAREILERIKNMYLSIPIWLQVGVKEWNKGSILLGNNCKVLAGSTSSDTIRGKSINFLYIDEVAFIDNNNWEPFWRSSYPTVSSSKKSKIVMSSTPNGMNHFYKLWSDSINNKNGFANFKVLWDRVPGRDEEWKNNTILEITLTRFMAEFECEFQGSAGTLISGKCLQNLIFSNPIKLLYDNKFSIFEEPNKDKKYILFSDFGEGTGNDYTSVQVIDITEIPWKQVAVYRDNEILIREAPVILNKIGVFYNNALIIGESNTIGRGILDDLNDDYEYPNLFYGDVLASGKAVDYFGIKSTKRSKKFGNSYFKEYIESGSLLINDFNTIEEMSCYIKKKDSYQAEEGKHDDLIMPLVLFSYFMQNKNWVEDWIESDTYNQNENTMNKIEENLLPIGFYNDGNELINLEEDNYDNDICLCF